MGEGEGAAAEKGKGPRRWRAAAVAVGVFTAKLKHAKSMPNIMLHELEFYKYGAARQDTLKTVTPWNDRDRELADAACLVLFALPSHHIRRCAATRTSCFATRPRSCGRTTTRGSRPRPARAPPVGWP